MQKEKMLNITFGTLYYILGIVGFFYLYMLAVLFGMISSFSQSLFIVCFIILPLIILILPVIIKKTMKQEFYKAILLSCISVIIYFIILFIIKFSILNYMSKFTIQKWNNDNYIDLRYLMLDDLEKKYDFIGMNKEKANQILGLKSYYNYDNGICYFIKNEWLNNYYYCLDYDENNIITKTYKKYID